MRRAAQWCRVGVLLAGFVVVGSTSCKPKFPPNEPVKMAPEGCCKLGNQKMTKFAGCRLTHRCKDDEPIWIRGAVNCTAVDEEKCFGGRCCEFQPLYGTPDSALQWDDDSDKPTGDKPGTAPASDAPASDAPASDAPASDAPATPPGEPAPAVEPAPKAEPTPKAAPAPKTAASP